MRMKEKIIIIIIFYMKRVSINPRIDKPLFEEEQNSRERRKLTKMK